MPSVDCRRNMVLFCYDGGGRGALADFAIVGHTRIVVPEYQSIRGSTGVNIPRILMCYRRLCTFSLSEL